MHLPPAIVHVHDPFLWPLGAEIAGCCDARLIHTTHVLSHVQDKLRGLEVPTKTSLAQARAFDKADLIIAPSPAVAGRLRDDRPDLGARLRVARLGVSTSDREVTKVRDLVFVGRYSDLAGIADLVAMVAALKRGMRLCVIGGLPDNQRAEARWNDALATAANGAGVELEIGGWQLGEVLADSVQSARVMVAPNRYATFGLAVAEAMAAGLAVCAFGVGGLCDLIDDQVNGRLLDVDPVRLARVATALLENNDERERLGKKARASVRERYTMAQAGADHAELYSELLSG